MYNAYCKLCSELLLNKDVCSETHPVYGLIMPKTQEAIVEEHYQKTHNPKQHRSKSTYAEYKTEHIQEFPLQNSGNSSGQPATKWCLVCGQKCTVENLCGCNTLPYSNRAPHSIKCCYKMCDNIISTTNMSYDYCAQHREQAERCSTKSTENEACPNPIAFKGTRYCGRHLETCWVEGCEHPISHPKTSKFCPDHARFSDAGASAPPPPRQKCSRCKAGEVFQNSLCQSCHQSQAEANFSDFVDAIVSAPTERYFLNEMP